ncbi:hypothetical protein AD998_06410 [bacterium 336/3]|nr:hypothetical protein AD998_06410 [bacterium 336/3]
MIKKILIVAFIYSFFTLNAQNTSIMKYQKIKGDFYKESDYKKLIERLDNITPNSQRKWGTMTVSQMLHHLNLAIGSGLGYYTLPDNSSFMSRGFNQFLILNVLKKFPTNTKTAKPLKVTENFDFETEKQKLKEILEKAYATKSDNDWGRHTYFGEMTRKAWGKLIMIHCNHHFQQFGN